MVATPGPDLSGIVKDPNLLIVLGKALFWDQQVGGDGITACATCHFHAGADHRLSNQANPGPDKAYGKPLVGPGLKQIASDFPFGQNTNKGLSQNDVMGSQGLKAANFVALTSNPFDQSTAPVGHRQVTGRNTPSAINATFNFRNFWDGRAAETFNGRSPFGIIDHTAQIVVSVNGTLAFEKLNLPFSSLASQAVGPPNNEVEMSYKGRDWLALGLKLLPRNPLALQLVSATDSVLGPYAKSKSTPNANGTTLPTYLDLVLRSFDSKYTANSQRVCYDPTRGVFSPALSGVTCLTGDPAGYSLAEANFSMFFGLAIQAYEQTLRSDATRFDAWSAGKGTLTAAEMRGLTLFYGPRALCGTCHFGPEFTSASVSALNVQQGGGAVAGAGFPAALLNVGLFNANAPAKIPPPTPQTTSLTIPSLPAMGFVPGFSPSSFALGGAAYGTTYKAQSVLLGPDKRFIGPFERMVMAYRRDSTNKLVPIDPLNPFNISPVVTSQGTKLGTELVNQRTQSPFGIYDFGFYNIGVRPDADDVGLGGTFPATLVGPGGFPGGGPIPLSFSRRVKANQADRTNIATDDRDYWPTNSSFMAFPFNTCVIQDRAVTAAQNFLTGRAVPGVLPFPSSRNLVNPQACNFFDPVTGVTLLDPFTLGPLVGGRVLNGATHQINSAGVKMPDLSCLGTNGEQPINYGLPGQCPEERDAITGAFKTPSLRNVEFTGPYFHNGSAKSLKEAVQFYTRNGHHVNEALSPELLAIPALMAVAFRSASALSAAEDDLVAFLLTLTDDRVAFSRAPFDHPALCVPQGQSNATDLFGLVPAIGAAGSSARLQTFEELLAGLSVGRENTLTVSCKPF